jgi:hypothetical protein
MVFSVGKELWDQSNAFEHSWTLAKHINKLWEGLEQWKNKLD